MQSVFILVGLAILCVFFPPAIILLFVGIVVALILWVVDLVRGMDWGGRYERHDKRHALNQIPVSGPVFGEPDAQLGREQHRRETGEELVALILETATRTRHPVEAIADAVGERVGVPLAVEDGELRLSASDAARIGPRMGELRRSLALLEMAKT